ncbi:photosystem reaction center subunit H [Clostridium sp. P21]|uniref:Photosystem reaction center subunit H n=1 Tax=Clostridium muellerianum TaxID=2716538 RepID=A0A7Y0ELB4_9CLOT|nr:photosystem reaction center subunit H [Clostridium muellerianum]
MYRSKDFSLMDVINVNGKRLGFINDLLVDFNIKKITGFSIATYGFLKKNLNVGIGDVVSFNSVMVITATTEESFLEFKNIKNMDVRDEKGNILGMVEDIIFDKISFKINALVVSMGFLSNFLTGKKIILIKDILIGEESLLYNGRNPNLNFCSLPHKLFMEDDLNEKDETEKNI